MLTKIKRSVAVKAYRLGLLPKRFAKSVEKNPLFADKTVVWNDKGFYELTPMPTQAQLDHYYSISYWLARGDQKNRLIDRDLDHWLTLRPFLNTILSKQGPYRFLNFGAGHGGISHLFFAAGFLVTNCEPSIIKSTFDGVDWTNLQTIYDIDESLPLFDLLYASHSIEHVQNIDTFFYKIDKLIKSGGFCFFEVPNCRQTNIVNPLNGGQNGKVSVPHTYYFTTDFFRGLPYLCLMLRTFSGAASPKKEALDEDGEVIRYLGRKI